MLWRSRVGRSFPVPLSLSLLDVSRQGLRAVGCLSVQAQLCLTTVPFSLTSFTSSVCVWGGGANLILGSSGVPRRGDVGGLRGQGGANLTLFSGDSFVQVSKFWPETSRDDSQTLLHSWAPAPLQLRASALLTSPWRAGSPYFSLVRLHLWAPSGVPESWDLEW